MATKLQHDGLLPFGLSGCLFHQTYVLRDLLGFTRTLITGIQLKLIDFAIEFYQF